MRGRSASRRLDREDAASRISAYVYGNILVLAALIALHPDDLMGVTGLTYIGGTALSTFVAHVVAECVGFRVRTDRRLTARDVRHEFRHAVPIAVSAVLPALFMGAVLLGWLTPATGLQLAIGATVLRLAALGWVVGHVEGERASVRTFLAGILLAVVCLGAAILKWHLTH